MFNIMEEISGAFSKGSPAVEAAEAPKWHSVYQGLIDRGMDAATAAAFTANIGAESNFNPSAVNEIGARGYAQWLGPRKTGLSNYADSQNVHWSDHDAQLDFMYDEYITGRDAGGVKELLEGVTDPQERARIVRQHYERPGKDESGYRRTANFASEIAAWENTQSDASGSVVNALTQFAIGSEDRADRITKMDSDPSIQFNTMIASADNPDMPYSVGEAMQVSSGPASQPPSGSAPSGGSVVSSTKSVEPEGGSVTSGISNMMQTLGATIFPNSDEPEEDMRTLIGGLGVGLGQMSHGNQVNLQPYFQNIQAKRQAVIDNQRQMQNDAIARQTDAFKMETARLNAQTARGNLDLAREAAVTERQQNTVPTFTPEQLTAFGMDEATAPFVTMLTSGDRETYDQGIEGLRQVIVDKVKNNETASTAMGDLYQAISDDAGPSEIAQIIRDGDIGAEEFNAVHKALGKQPSPFVKEIDEYMDAIQNDPPRARAMERRWQNMIGSDETPRERDERERAYKYADELDAASLQSAPIFNNLVRMEQLTERMIEEGTEGGPLTDAYLAFSGGIRQTFGAGAADFLADFMGDPTLLTEMDQTEKALALMIAQPLMQGGGSISDGERKSMLKMLSQGKTTHEARLNIIQKLKTEAKLDQIVAQEYNAQLGDDYSKARTLRSDLRLGAAELMPELGRAAQAVVGITKMNKIGLDGFAHFKVLTTRQKVEAMSPRLTQEQYDTFKDALIPYGKEQYRLWAKVDPDNPNKVTYMRDNDPISFKEN